MQILQLDEFLRSIKQNIDTPHSLLLGAGASIESGIPSAVDCIWDWKREIYLSQNPGAIGNFDNSKSEGVRRVIQRWIDSQNVYPEENSAEEYSYFAEKAYPIADDRRKYFQHLVVNHDPSLGYHLISLLALENIIKSVWTTNFDGMTLKCAHQYNQLVPIEIAAETSDRIYRGDVDKELLCIALHGDYKYGALKNTEKELDSQDGELVKALLHELTNRDLIVMGYSGRDHSLMNALQQVYSSKGAGKLFWCGYGTRASSEVKALLEMANESGRAAFYIPTEGFDSTMYADDVVLMKAEKKQFADWFNAKVNNGRPNQNANEYIRKWVRKVIGNRNFSASFPLGNTTNFTFSAGNSSALVGVNYGKQTSIQLPNTISPKRIIFSGIEYRDPTLRFCSSSMYGVAEDFHPMRGLISNAPVDHAMNNGVLHSAISVEAVHSGFLDKRDDEYDAIHEYYDLYMQATRLIAESFLICDETESAISVFDSCKQFICGLDFSRLGTVLYAHKQMSKSDLFYHQAAKAIAKERTLCLESTEPYDVIEITLDGADIMEVLASGNQEETR